MRDYKFTFDTEIERSDDVIDVRVAYSVTPFIQATWLQPAEGGEVEILSVKSAGQVVQLTDSEEAAILAECEERCRQDIADEEAEKADWRYQEYRDRLLMEQWERDQ